MTNRYSETTPRTLIAEVNGNKLFRIDDGGVWEGDFYFELADGEQGFIDGMYARHDEPALVIDFTKDYS